MTRSNLFQPLAQRIQIRPAQIGAPGVTFLVASHQTRKSLAQEREENLLRRGHQKQDAAAEILSARPFRGSRQPVEIFFAVGDQRQNRIREHAHHNSSVRELLDGSQPQVRPWRAGLEHPGKLRLQRRDGDVHVQDVSPRDFSQQIDITAYKV